MAGKKPTLSSLKAFLKNNQALADELAYALPRAYSVPALYLFCDGGVVYSRCKATKKTQSEGKGGWGVALLLIEEGEPPMLTYMSGGHPLTTNNKMELQAVISSLLEINDIEDIRTNQTRAHIISDSQYVVKGATEWMAGWKARNFEDVKNVPYWQQFLMASKGLRPTWHHCRGHRNKNDFPARSWDRFTAIGNDIADKLATLGRLQLETVDDGA
ncbi:MAG: ribonuclease HI [Aestuariibacter sp.]|nr:ribonuclease HI [Aestuariibacter sp.]|tara:strand:+ start:24609 stop:25253 length:645 start_codon:yes stop_codon:yes gene_type:complete